MKRSNIIRCLSALLLACSCNYLDVDPELGVSDDEVFGNFRGIKRYLEFYYDGGYKDENIYCAFPNYVNMTGQRFCWDATTDAADNGYLNWATTFFKKGVLQEKYIETFCDSGGDRPIAWAMFKCIRVANMTLEKMHLVADGTEKEKNDLRGQAYFLRGYAHFCLCRLYGGMPYIDHVLKADDQWDLPRLSPYETLVKAAEDMQRSYEMLESAGKVRRDGYPGEAGYMTAVDWKFPSGIAAKAMQSRILLYAASPLNNRKGKEDWENAAKSAAEALQMALKEHYYLPVFEDYANNFVNYSGTEETIWAGYPVSSKDNAAEWKNYLAYPQSNYATAGGLCPTQNFVDRFETIYGDPLNTEEDRKEAERLGHFNPQDPYRNLDPRFDVCIVYDGGTNVSGTGGKPVNIYFDTKTQTYPKTTLSNTSVQFGIEWGSKDTDTKGYSNTGYYYKKMWSGAKGDKSNSHVHADPILRLSEVYLNYAEAVNEAYGPQGKAPGCDLTAVQAVNVVRNRCNMPDVLDKYVSSADKFRERVRNERCVELAFEGNNYYYDIRRWKIAPQTMTATLYGMYIETCPDGYDPAKYPNGKIYERRPLPEIRQCTWKDYMYYYPFSRNLFQTMKNFVNNESWNQ